MIDYTIDEFLSLPDNERENFVTSLSEGESHADEVTLPYMVRFLRATKLTVREYLNWLYGSCGGPEVIQSCEQKLHQFFGQFYSQIDGASRCQYIIYNLFGADFPISWPYRYEIGNAKLSKKAYDVCSKYASTEMLKLCS